MSPPKNGSYEALINANLWAKGRNAGSMEGELLRLWSDDASALNKRTLKKKVASMQYGI